jgi:hypothetical protein
MQLLSRFLLYSDSCALNLDHQHYGQLRTHNFHFDGSAMGRLNRCSLQSSTKSKRLEHWYSNQRSVLQLYKNYKRTNWSRLQFGAPKISFRDVQHNKLRGGRSSYADRHSKRKGCISRNNLSFRNSIIRLMSYCELPKRKNGTSNRTNTTTLLESHINSYCCYGKLQCYFTKSWFITSS